MRHLREDAAVAEVLRLPLAAGQPVVSVVSGGSVVLRVRLGCVLLCVRGGMPQSASGQARAQ